MPTFFSGCLQKLTPSGCGTGAGPAGPGARGAGCERAGPAAGPPQLLLPAQRTSAAGPGAGHMCPSAECAKPGGSHLLYGSGSKIGAQNGTLANGNKD